MGRQGRRRSGRTPTGGGGTPPRRGTGRDPGGPLGRGRGPVGGGGDRRVVRTGHRAVSVIGAGRAASAGYGGGLRARESHRGGGRHEGRARGGRGGRRAWSGRDRHRALGGRGSRLRDRPREQRRPGGHDSRADRPGGRHWGRGGQGRGKRRSRGGHKGRGRGRRRARDDHEGRARSSQGRGELRDRESHRGGGGLRARDSHQGRGGLRARDSHRSRPRGAPESVAARAAEGGGVPYASVAYAFRCAGACAIGSRGMPRHAARPCATAERTRAAAPGWSTAVRGAPKKRLASGPGRAAAAPETSWRPPPRRSRCGAVRIRLTRRGRGARPRLSGGRGGSGR